MSEVKGRLALPSRIAFWLKIEKVWLKLDKILPTGDLAFKKVLSSEENKDILSGLIRDFFFFDVRADDLTIEHPYSIAAYQEYIEGKEVSLLRHTVKDIVATIDPLRDVSAFLSKADFISEMQIRKTKYFAERFLYYPFERFCQNYGQPRQMTEGYVGGEKRYSSIRPVYALNIIGEPHFTQDDDNDAFRIFEMYDPQRNKIYPKQLIKIGFFELTKSNVETPQQRYWQTYFNTGFADPDAPEYIQKAAEIIKFDNLTKEERRMASALEKAQAIRDEEISSSYFDGLEEGIAKGRAEGISEGISKSKVEIALKFIKLGIDLQDIAEGTNISLNELKALKQEMGL